MFEITAKDGAARLGRWEVQAGQPVVATPAVLYVDSARIPAPAFAEVLLTDAPGRTPGKPSIHPGGSRFYPATSTEGASLVIQNDLPYAPAGGPLLLEAAQTLNQEMRQPGQATVVVSPKAEKLGDEFAVLANARALFDNPYQFAAHIAELRSRVGYAPLLYAPGVGLPHEIAILVYAGIDVVDNLSAVLAARAGQYLTAEGPVSVDAVRAPGTRPCLCPACQGAGMGYEWLRDHNTYAVHQEMLRVRAAIADGRLRELVEARTRARPYLAAHLRRMDKEQYAYFEERAPTTRTGTLYATSKESLERPEVVRYRKRLEERYRKPESARVLLILPCSARKPYSDSRTHRTFENALFGTPNRGAVHEVILTSPLGLVPREWETVYPAAHYDLPVTGHWDEDERKMIRDTWAAFLKNNHYDHVICHLEKAERDLILDVLPEHKWTAPDDNPLSTESLGNMRAAVHDMAGPGAPVNFRARETEDMISRARWQFGIEGAAALGRNTTIRGKLPFVKLLDATTDQQVAMLTDRGLLSLTLEGGKRLLEAGVYRVEIENFKPKGTVFAVGVIGGDAEVRPEDEVVLHHKGELKAVGRARMSGPEMVQFKRGPAVDVRHYVGASK
ncbi:MAG TPA: archaeosine synthase subunit alpha [Candidatus Thermoplasmatota archaeon]|nr:archaeosine synthase subunit alpha [Candidatus Thermoplasmatota archaeon]